LKVQIEKANEQLQNARAEKEALLTSNFKEATQMRERYQQLIRILEDLAGPDDSFIAILKQHSPNEPGFLEFAVEIEDKVKELSNAVNDNIINKENELASVNHNTTELKGEKAGLLAELNKLQRQISKLAHSISIKREDWDDERRKVNLEVDVAQNELDSLNAVRNGKLSAYEQLAEAKKEQQSRQIEIENTKKKIVNEVAIKFSETVKRWEHLKLLGNLIATELYQNMPVSRRLCFGRVLCGESRTEGAQHQVQNH
uniref:SMC_N domain-containing protein n=1 Tax=Gongylonema pulchrum TaxID=637853 RepID=A0A183CYB0_9BILA